MRELQVLMSDDLVWSQTGERVPADETVTVSLDGKTRELDLTKDNAEELRGLLGPWLDAGHPPGRQPDAPSTHRGGHGRTRSVTLTASRAAQREVRDFADSLGLKSDDGKRPIYRTPSGGYYYPDRLRKMWAAHLAAQSEEQETDYA